MIVSLLACLALSQDIVFIVLDDISPSDVEAINTPSIDQLASEGMSFSRAYSNPTCSPTRLSMFYGSWTARHFRTACADDPANPFPDPLASPQLDPSWLSMPEMAVASGYTTALVGKWHTGTDSLGWQIAPMAHGYIHWLAGGPATLQTSAGMCNSSGFEDWQRVDNGILSMETRYATTAQVEAARQWAYATPGSKFLFLSFHTPHTPLHTPPTYSLPPGYELPEDPTPRDMFEAMVVSVDWEIGRLLPHIPQDAWVFFLSDNGTFAGNVAPGADPNKAKRTTFEGGIHVPLIVRGPGVKHDTQCGELVSLVDLFATTADILGHPTPPQADDSISMLPLLLDPTHSPIRTMAYAGHIRQGVSGWTTNDQAAFSLTHKLRRPNGPTGGEELYDLVNDPNEEAPIVNESIAAPLRSFLDAALQTGN